MNSNTSLWFIAGIIIGTVAGFLLGNISAGICLGTTVGLLTMLLSFTRTEQKNRN
jgi:mannose/fructose/N-acetylgalactosamine-specific phosphotransferase system component IIC